MMRGGIVMMGVMLVELVWVCVASRDHFVTLGRRFRFVIWAYSCHTHWLE